MKKQSSNGAADVKDVSATTENNANNDDVAGVPPFKDVRKWLVDDVRRAISLLNAINADPDLQDMMAKWFQGRIMNAKMKHDPVDPAQVKMFDGVKQ